MTICWAAIKTFVIGAIFLAPAAAHATIVDFTSNDSNGITGSSYTVGDVMLSSNTGPVTFNGSDGVAGCGNSNKLGIETTTGLDCAGDGIRIANDEITQGGNQSLVATFDDGPVTFSTINSLDSFANEAKGAKAVAIPIPSAIWMFGTALLGFVAMSRRIKV
jgi:hypothetical protein